MGIELDVLVGHPEHDLLFAATQVARAADLKHPSMAVQGMNNKNHKAIGAKVCLGDLSPLLRGSRTLPNPTWLFDELRVYQMLLEGAAPQSEPFRRWVTEEVLPTIRKTGSYDAAKSDHPVAQGVMDELKALLCRFCGVGRGLALRISSRDVVLIA
jgi:prophage antirepressor-like protein